VQRGGNQECAWGGANVCQDQLLPTISPQPRGTPWATLSSLALSSSSLEQHVYLSSTTGNIALASLYHWSHFYMAWISTTTNISQNTGRLLITWQNHAHERVLPKPNASCLSYLSLLPCSSSGVTAPPYRTSRYRYLWKLLLSIATKSSSSTVTTLCNERQPPHLYERLCYHCTKLDLKAHATESIQPAMWGRPNNRQGTCAYIRGINEQWDFRHSGRRAASPMQGG
jgi:hypothetical protein